MADQPSAAIVELLATNLPRMVAEEPEQVFDLIGGQWQILVLSPANPLASRESRTRSPDSPFNKVDASGNWIQPPELRQVIEAEHGRILD